MCENAEIFVLGGVTAVGKTAASLAWAERGDAEILSCDSLLFYRGMDIGTAKPTLEERSRVAHHGIDLVTVDQPYDVASYLDYAHQVVRDVIDRGKKVLVVGGSGFYLQAFFAPVIDEVEVPDALRSQVLDWEQEEGLSGLLRRLHELNPEGIGDLDSDNPRRVTRALERCLASGQSLLALKESFQKADFPFRKNPKITWILDREDFDLEERVKERVSLMLDDGLLTEVQALREMGLERNPSACRAVGYRETLLHLDGRYSSDQWREAIVSATLRLARKQRKWFRSRLPADRVVLLAEHEEIGDLPAPWELQARS